MDRKQILLNDGWKFHYGEIPQAWYKGYDDRAWESVSLPHDWSVHMPFEQTNSSGTGYLSGGIGWYRLRFSLPQAYQGKSVRIVFDGIYKNSRIWCNSYHLGKRPFGYGQISYDISDFVQFGQVDNEVTVRVCHTDLADSRWFTGSGIYRKAYLVVEERVHPVWNGVVFQTVSSDPEQAQVKVLAELVNTTGQRQQGELRCVLEPKKKTQEAAELGSVFWELDAGETKTISLEASISHPALWSCETPDLYELSSYLWQGDSQWMADRQTVGIRSFRFDPDHGFFLNEKETKLKGVCVHHDGGCLGAAMYREVWLRRLLKLKDCGCNAIRTSHNPHMPELYELCDELGLLMIDEAFDEWENPKNKWSTGHNVYPPKHEGYAEDFPEWHERDLRDMVRRDRNHPSIVMWSIGNEIDYPNDPYCHPLFESMTGNNDANKPASERQYDPNKPNAERLAVIAAQLSAQVRKEDQTRPVSLAAAFPELSSHLGFFDSLDVVGYNYKEHLYQESHQRFPDKPFLGSENGHGYQAWLAVRDNAYISGQFLWTGIDYLGEAHGWPIRGAAAGLLDLAGFEKPGFYRRKAFWTEKPYACLLSLPDDGDRKEWSPMNRFWQYMPGQKVLVRCFTNLEQAELFLNGKSLGVQRELNEQGCFEWQVSYEAGSLTAVCTGAEGSLQVQEQTPGAAADVTVTPWKPQEEGLASETPEVLQYEVVLRDAKGNMAPESRLVTAETIGCTLLGLENGDVADLTPYNSNYRCTREGRLIVYVKPGEKGILRIHCEGLGIKEIRV